MHDLTDRIKAAQADRASATVALATAKKNAAAARSERNRIPGTVLGIELRRERLAQVEARIAAAEHEANQARTRISEIDRQLATLEREPELRELLGPLPGTDLPLALLPVRLETRFVTRDNKPELLLRIYPDDIHLDTHEPELTDDEALWSQDYWRHLWQIGTGIGEIPDARRRQAWAQLAQRFGADRAAWIAWALRPSNLDEWPSAPVDNGTEPPTAPRFPDPPRRRDSWTRPPLVRCLPDRWVVCAYRDGRRVLLHWGEPIVDSLAAGPDPSAPPPDVAPEELAVDEGMRWLIDFETALRVGMAMRIALDAEHAQRGFDTLLVYGAKTAPHNPTAPGELETALLGHLYTEGLDFISPNTPTNNTADTDSGFSPRDPSRAETPPPLIPRTPSPESDGALTSRLLGLPPALLGRLAQADATDRSDARAMITALWPATGGYFLEQMLADTFAPSAIDGARRHTIAFVRARGPLPTLRVGPQPYGLLPASSLDLWRAREGEDPFVSILRSLRERWRSVTDRVPRLDRSSNESNPEQRILDVLEGDAVSSHYAGRLMFDRFMFAVPELHRNAPPFPPLEQRRATLRQTLDQLGLDWTPRLLETVLANQVFPVPTNDTPAEPSSNGTAPPAVFIRWLRESPYEAIRDETGLSGRPPNSLVYLLLRHAVLTAYAMTAFRIQLAAGAAQPADLREPAVLDLNDTPTRTLGRHPERTLPGLGNRALHTLTAVDHPAASALEELRAGLEQLEALPAETLDLLLRETLDLFAYRLDAWITSLATRRLERMRESVPRGIGLGGYGWLEDVRPAPPKPAADPPPGDPGPLTVNPRSAGFIHTPSLNQAATAAILRSGQLSSPDGSNKLFNLDLSSRRVRLAEFLLDGIRQGQPLAALLGYRFERALHDRNLDRFIAIFRRVAPFGELLKARVALEKAEAEIARLQALGHPGLPARQTAVAAAKKRHQDLLKEKRALPARMTAAERDVERFAKELAAINADIKRVGNLIIRFQTSRPPRQTDQLNEQLADLLGRRLSLDRSHKEATTRAAKAKSRLRAIPGEITRAKKALQEAERLANELLGRPHPALAAAQRSATDARARHQQLLDAHRQAFLLPQHATQKALESIAAVHVVDGLALLKLFEAGDLSFGRDGLPSTGSRDHASLIAELESLLDAVDAVRDALVAESVFQLVQGRPERAGADLDAIAGGDMPPPELELLRTPRHGKASTHRVLALFTTREKPDSWPESPRAQAEPALNAWAAHLFGDPARIRFRAEYSDAVTGKTLLTRDLRLTDAPLAAPIDLLHLALLSDNERYPDVERLLTAILARQRPADVPPGSAVRIIPERPPESNAQERSLTELLDLANAAGHLAAEARPLEDADLARPGDSTAVSADTAELLARADHAAQALQRIHAELDTALEANPGPDTIADILTRVALFGLHEAIPGPTPGHAVDELRAQAQGVRRTLARRLAQLESETARLNPENAAPEKLRDHALARLKIIFGSAFHALPKLRPARLASLAEAFDHSLELQGGDAFATRTWVARLARVRRPMDRFNTLLCYTEAFDGSPPPLPVAQFPTRHGERWCALPPAQGAKPADDALSLVAHLPQPFDPAAPLAGLWIDEWIEVIPEPDVTTGIAFHFDQPGAQPPQAILIATPPDDNPNWDISDLEAITLETLDLARLRAVDPETLDAHTDLGQLLPALCFSLNLRNHTVSTDFRRAAKPSA